MSRLAGELAISAATGPRLGFGPEVAQQSRFGLDGFAVGRYYARVLIHQARGTPLLAHQAHRPFPALPSGMAVAEAPVEPTFYLGGQPYIFEREEVSRVGPEITRLALYETWRQVWVLGVQWQQGRMDDLTLLQRITELYFGAYLLRDLIPSTERMFPNGPFTQVH